MKTLVLEIEDNAYQTVLDFIMKNILDSLISDELKQTLSDNLNSKTLLMNPQTATVQSAELWRSEKTESFNESELVEVKLINHEWVRVN